MTWYDIMSDLAKVPACGPGVFRGSCISATTPPSIIFIMTNTKTPIVIYIYIYTYSYMHICTTTTTNNNHVPNTLYEMV